MGWWPWKSQVSCCLLWPRLLWQPAQGLEKGCGEQIDLCRGLIFPLGTGGALWDRWDVGCSGPCRACVCGLWAIHTGPEDLWPLRRMCTNPQRLFVSLMTSRLLCPWSRHLAAARAKGPVQKRTLHSPSVCRAVSRRRGWNVGWTLSTLRWGWRPCDGQPHKPWCFAWCP